eukprot:TRINITY_DN17680_c0_g1_i2.p1 TRINITY_DN17680_c0_g1~~TRINITY_DN17680_c0_g1_i2.p1  ORF type:complete len:234 (-),score=32.16 TRINITY_DN17680_c0_g1_i2:148-828(-)
MIRRPPRSTHCISSAASDVYKRQLLFNDFNEEQKDSLFKRVKREMPKRADEESVYHSELTNQRQIQRQLDLINAENFAVAVNKKLGENLFYECIGFSKCESLNAHLQKVNFQLNNTPNIQLYSASKFRSQNTLRSQSNRTTIYKNISKHILSTNLPKYFNVDYTPPKLPPEVIENKEASADYSTQKKYLRPLPKYLIDIEKGPTESQRDSIVKRALAKEYSKYSFH